MRLVYAELDGQTTMVLVADRLSYRLICYHRHAD